MKKIDIEDDLYKHILANIEEFGETPSQILRRLLDLPKQVTEAEFNSFENVAEKKVVAVDIVSPAQVLKVKVDKSATPSHSFANASLPEAFANGISALFSSETFQKEPIITNKFKMMFTTMYYEDKEAFISASKVAKGRSRDYLGINLDKLLRSSNKEEVDLLVASKPRDIPYTPFWVVTNANTGRKRIILTQVMASMGYPHHLIERINEEI